MNKYDQLSWDSPEKYVKGNPYMLASYPNVQEAGSRWTYGNIRGNEADLPLAQQAGQSRYMVKLYQKNPIAHRYVEILTAFVMGDGPVPVAKEDALNELLQEYWYNDHNRWHERCFEFARDLSIYGEHLIKHFELYPDDPGAAIMGIQHFDPAKIQSIRPSERDLYQPGSVLYHKEEWNYIDERLKDYKIVRADLKHRGGLEGEVFYTRINNTGTSLRGISDLWRLNDWIVLYDRHQLALAERLIHSNGFFYSAEIEGAGPAEILKWQEHFLQNPPLPGTFYTHNEAVKIEPITVDLGDSSNDAPGQGMRSMINNGTFTPPHWDGSEASRSVAEASADPTYRFFTLRQQKIKAAMSEMIKMQMQYAEPGKNLTQSHKEFMLVFPRLGIRDLQRAGGAAKPILEALRMALELELVGQPEARRMLHNTFREVNLIQPDNKNMDFDAQPDISDRVKELFEKPEPAMGMGGMDAMGSKPTKKAKTTAESLLGRIDDIYEEAHWPTEAERETAQREVLSILHELETGG